MLFSRLLCLSGDEQPENQIAQPADPAREKKAKCSDDAQGSWIATRKLRDTTDDPSDHAAVLTAPEFVIITWSSSNSVTISEVSRFCGFCICLGQDVASAGDLVDARGMAGLRRLSRNAA